MLSGVSTICFAGSYAVALLLEVSRLAFRSRAWRLGAIIAAAAGLVAHSAFLFYRALSEPSAPLSSERDWYLVASSALVAVYLWFATHRPKVPFGLVLLPLSLLLIAIATFWASPKPLDREPASKIWGAIDGGSIALAVAAVLVGFGAGLMYLGQARRLKHKHVAAGLLRLPSLEWLQWANGRAIVASALMLGVGVLSGAILNRIHQGEPSPPVAWNDPIALGTWLMFAWLMAAAFLVVLYRPARQGRKVAYLTLASFVFLVIMLAAGLLTNSRHWGGGGQGSGFRGQGSGFRVQGKDKETRRGGDEETRRQEEGNGLRNALSFGGTSLSPYLLVSLSPCLRVSSDPSSLIPHPSSPGGRPCS